MELPKNPRVIYGIFPIINLFDLVFGIGLLSEPKWGHLKDLHAAIKLCEPALVAADSPQYIKLGPKQEVCVNPYFIHFFL